MAIRFFCLLLIFSLGVSFTGYAYNEDSVDGSKVSENKEAGLNSENLQETEDDYFSNQTVTDGDAYPLTKDFFSEVYKKQQDEFKTLLNSLSVNSGLSFEEKVGELDSILLKQQKEMIANITIDKEDGE